jgi:predicted metal-dependent hydrolase
MPRRAAIAKRVIAPKAAKSELAVKGLDAPVEVRRHPSARRLTLRVSQTRRAVIVTVPTRCRIDEASLFVHRNIDWVRKRLDALPGVVPFADGMVLPLRGVPHRVRFVSVAGVGAIVRREIAADGKPEIVVRGRAEHCPRRLKDWLYAQAKADLDRCVMFHAGRLGLRPRRLALRDQASRWGSCSTTGMLSFSWRLVLAPPLVLDYVAAHEVAHLAEMNHGPRFWSLVRQTMPDMDNAKTWLSTHGLALHRYGASPDDAGKGADGIEAKS